MWRYEQATGELVKADGELIGQGYSGSPEGRNDPAKEALHNIGPIPKGIWRVTEKVDSDTLGPCVLVLTPEPETETFGRTDFRMHGERKDQLPGHASEGCIIQRRPVREAVWDSPDHLIEVV